MWALEACGVHTTGSFPSHCPSLAGIFVPWITLHVGCLNLGWTTRPIASVTLPDASRYLVWDTSRSSMQHRPPALLTNGCHSAHIGFCFLYFQGISASAPNWRPAEEFSGPRDEFSLCESREQGVVPNLRQGQGQGQRQGQGQGWGQGQDQGQGPGPGRGAGPRLGAGQGQKQS